MSLLEENFATKRLVQEKTFFNCFVNSSKSFKIVNMSEMFNDKRVLKKGLFVFPETEKTKPIAPVATIPTDHIRAGPPKPADNLSYVSEKPPPSPYNPYNPYAIPVSKVFSAVQNTNIVLFILSGPIV